MHSFRTELGTNSNGLLCLQYTFKTVLQSKQKDIKVSVSRMDEHESGKGSVGVLSLS
jgi:hypothetical protein